MEERKVNFFEKMKTAEHRGFEISMFAVSILMAVVVLISIVMLGIYWGKGSSNTVSDDGTDDMATSSAVTVDNDEDSAVATQPPENPIISEDDFGSSDEDLKAGEFAYTTAYVNMRSEASLSASVVTKVPSGTKLKLLELEKEEWFKVDYNGTEGYINTMYLSREKPAPIATATPAPTARATERPEKTPKPTIKPTKKPTPKPTKKPPVKTESPKETPTPAPEPLETAAVVTPEPTPVPTKAPTPAPTEKPTQAPTEPPQNTSEPQGD